MAPEERNEYNEDNRNNGQNECHEQNCNNGRNGFPRRADRKRRRRSHLAGLVAAMILLAAGAVVGYMDFTSPFADSRFAKPAPAPDSTNSPEPENEEGGTIGEAAASSRWRITTEPHTLLIFKTMYPHCNGETTTSRTAGTAMAGINRDELARRYPEYEIASFRPGEVTFLRTLDGPCPDEAWYRTITLKEGRIVVYAGRPGNLGPLLQDTGIPIDKLLPADQDKFEEGVVVTGDAGVWLYLEGLELN